MLFFIFKVLLGSTMTVLNMAILIWAANQILPFVEVKATQYFARQGKRDFVRALSIIMAFLFFGHMLQFASWATLFYYLDEFSDFETAFYHSAVNFTSLGYGDIVMSEKWRLLGALEAANGVLMFGLSAGMFLSVMNRLHHIKTKTLANAQRETPNGSEEGVPARNKSSRSDS